MIFLPLLRSVMISAVAETVMAEARRSVKI
jgi:hypothetical protein